MAWQLTIYTIDVGQGESALIVAEDVPGGLHRTMLIDGGLPGMAQTVHNFVVANLPAGYGLDHILVTHYDKDHVGGVMGLLNADNMTRVSEEVANAVTTWAQNVNANTRPKSVAFGAVAAMATILGAYGVNAGQIAGMCAAVAPMVAGMNDANAAATGFDWAENHMAWPLSPTLNVGATARRRDIARDCAVAAANAIAGGAAVYPAVLNAALNLICTTLSPIWRFNTGGLYHNTRLIDIGGGPEIYSLAAQGQYNPLGGGIAVIAPGINRVRTTPLRGSEILWNIGLPFASPANSPAVFCLAINQWVWQGIGVPPAQVFGGEPSNRPSIGLIIRFGNFYFYTGGDLPSGGEDPLATAVMGQPLPNPLGGTFAPPARIAAFKCGHHGSDYSTSQNFLNRTQARGAFISAGVGEFGTESLPSQEVVNRLHGQAILPFFYLTNCNYIRTYVPASNGQDQLAFGGNKSRVAGQNHLANLNPLRQRGNIRLFLNQNESVGAGVPQRYHVTYFDDDAVAGVPVGLRTEITNF